MADRKVLNKYFPPDFDPEKLWKNKRFLRDPSVKKGPKAPKQMHMRMMFPFTLSCSSCNEFTYVGTKFNSRVEKVQGDDYLGIAIWRFYGRCPNCRNEITFKTDPKNGDYVLEFGGTRTYDAAKDTEKAENALKEQKESDLAGDRMKQVEAKTYNTQLELQTLEQLDEIRQMNKQLVDRNFAADTALKYLHEREIDSSVAINEDQAACVSEFEREMMDFKQELEERDHALATEAELDRSNSTSSYSETKTSTSQVSLNPVLSTDHLLLRPVNIADGEPAIQNLSGIRKLYPKLHVKPKKQAVEKEVFLNDLLAGYESSEEEKCF